ncbi:MAG: COQ9 family protein [Rhodobacteraceae bacterium]|nr:COQ9 family protein [Paracoccaceae bacterium]
MESNGLDVGRARESLLDAALAHVPFDGWSAACLDRAAADAGLEPGLVRAICPRGALDLAVAYHRRGDRAMAARLAGADLSAMRYRDRVATAVRWRIEAASREPVRRAAALFALPQNAPVGAGLVWDTADAIWTALGDTARDVNWYTKRAILAGVHSATVLFWLGDRSEGDAATWDFLDRRIEDVMRFERFKAKVRDNPAMARILAGPLRVLSGIRAPGAAR